MKPTLGLFFVLWCSLTQAASFTDSFNDRSLIDSTTLVFNQHLGSLHPTLLVTGFDDGSQTADFEVGDGSDGAFNSSTYAQFSENGDISGNTIRLNTDTFTVLNFTEFHLQAGWTLRPIGSNPLVIRSLGRVLIEGSINCNGEPGGDSSGATSGIAGAGRCGGGSGGVGGLPNGNGGNGLSPSLGISGGFGGNFQNPAVGGGGGGSWNQTSGAGNGNNASGAGGLGGASQSDPGFSVVSGGAGGGGGSGNGTDAGGGGGAGGGVILISAVGNVTLGLSGRIDASGGSGGDSTGNGGGGGGGGGGSIRVFAGGEIAVLNPDGGGAIQALVGTGGSNALLAPAANGGPGRNWFAATSYNFVGFSTPAPEGTFIEGDVTFSSASQSLITRSFDLNSYRARFSRITTNPVSADYTIEIAGSDDDFLGDDTGWTTDLDVVAGKRYFRLRITVTNSGGASPVFLDSLRVDYSLEDLNDFDFVSASCARIDNQNPQPLFFLFLPLLMAFWLRRKSQQVHGC